jgi:hypothetical protein
MRAAIVAVAVVAAACFLLVVLSGSEPRRSGTDDLAPAGVAATLAPGERACQPTSVPDDSARVALAGAPAAGGAGAARLTVTVERGGEVVARGRFAGLTADGRLDVALASTPPPGPAELCVRNAGRQPLTLLGAPEVLAVDYYRAGDESWWQVAPAVADRFGLGKAGFVGSWALWLALGAVVAAWLAAGWALRGDPR